MEHAGEYRCEGGADLVQIAEGQRGVVQLPVVHLFAHQLANQLFHLFRAGVGQRAGGRLNGVGQHDHSGLLAPGARPLVSEGGDVNVLAVELDGLVVEVEHQRIAVVLADDVDHGDGDALLGGHLCAIPGMGGENGGGDAGIGAVVGIVAHLVFLEVHGALELAHVVIICADAGQQTVSAHRRRAGLGQVGDDDGVVVGARRFHQQPPQQRLVGIGQFDELGIGGQVEQPLQQRLKADGQHGAEHAAADGPARVGDGRAQIRTRHQTDGQYDGKIHQRDGEARKQRAGAQLLAGEDEGRHRARRKGHEQYGKHRHGEQAVGGDQHGDHETQHGVDEHGRLGVQKDGNQNRTQRHGHQIGIDAPYQQGDGQFQHDDDAQEQ